MILMGVTMRILFYILQEGNFGARFAGSYGALFIEQQRPFDGGWLGHFTEDLSIINDESVILLLPVEFVSCFALSLASACI